MPTTDEKPLTDTRPAKAYFRELSPEEIANLDIDTVAKNNSTSLEQLIENNSTTRQLSVDSSD